MSEELMEPLLRVRKQDVILSDPGFPARLLERGWGAKDLGFRWFVDVLPLAAEIIPLRIDGFNQCDLLLANPTLDFLFAREGIVHL